MVGEASIISRASQARRTFQKILSQDPSRIEENDEFEFHLYKSDWKVSWEKGNRAIELARQVREQGYYTV